MGNFLKLICYFGGINGVRIYFKLKSKQEQIIRVKQFRNPVYLRENSTDHTVFKQIFVGREYDFEIPFKPRNILDGGANIGLAALYFASRFKDLVIISVEPDAENIQAIKRNIQNYPNVKIFQSAIWHTSAYLKVIDPGYGKWALKVEEVSKNDPQAFKATTINEIMKLFNVDSFDIIKLDIEGAEREIFLNNNYLEWIKNTRMLIIEIHDFLYAGLSTEIIAKMKSNNFSHAKHGEYEIFTNCNLVNATSN